MLACLIFLSLVFSRSEQVESENRNTLLWIDGYSVRLVSLNGEAGCELGNYPGVSKDPPHLTFLELEEKIAICEGKGEGWGTNPTGCYTFDGMEWGKIASLPANNCSTFMPTSSQYIKGIGWWIHESQYFCGGNIFSQLLTLDGEWIEGPKPTNEIQEVEMTASCAVQFNSTLTLFTGGTRIGYEARLEYGTEAVRAYEWRTSTWVELADMNVGRLEHGCALLDGERILVLGDANAFEEQDHTIEVLNHELNDWSVDQNIPATVYPRYPTLLSWRDVVILLETDTTNVWIRDEDGTWSKMKSVNMGGIFSGDKNKAVLVPDTFLLNC